MCPVSSCVAGSFQMPLAICKRTRVHVLSGLRRFFRRQWQRGGQDDGVGGKVIRMLLFQVDWQGGPEMEPTVRHFRHEWQGGIRWCACSSGRGCFNVAFPRHERHAWPVPAGGRCGGSNVCKFGPDGIRFRRGGKLFSSTPCPTIVQWNAEAVAMRKVSPVVLSVPLACSSLPQISGAQANCAGPTHWRWIRNVFGLFVLFWVRRGLFVSKPGLCGFRVHVHARFELFR